MCLPGELPVTLKPQILTNDVPMLKMKQSSFNLHIIVKVLSSTIFLKENYID